MTVRRSGHDGKVPEDPGKESSRSIPDRDGLLSERAALILIAGLVIGVAAGVLAYFAGSKLAAAVLTGGGAFAGAIVLLNSLIR